MCRIALALWLIVALRSACAFATEPLGRFPVDPTQVSVAGLSSGAFMANQLHIAHSADVMGAALIAGGLYGCAAIDVTSDGVRALASRAAGPCMKAPARLEKATFYADLVNALAAKGWIDPPSNLERSKVYIFTGGADDVLSSQTVEEARVVYAALGVPAENVVFEDKSGPAADAGHAWVTKNFGGECSVNAAPYINDCRYDQAGAELKAIYGQDLAPAADAPSGRIVAFDQTEFARGNEAAANGLSDTGYLYVPKNCEPGAARPCRLQVVLHDCEQSAEKIGDEFMTKIGLNEWADANGILVLYPQAHATTVADLPPEDWPASWASYVNQYGCWNWWGYSGDAQYLTKKGVQVGAIWKMVERIEGK